jgi:NAD(P)-dependent dehydrogenase (short-subunit alcohol dehydrogenase family)
MPGRLSGKVAVVTGAGSRGAGTGNGRAVAILFAREEAKVLCADLVRERAEETSATIEGEGGEASAIQADVTSKQDCERMVAAAVERYGRLDVLHNNVGVDSAASIRDLTEDEWDRVLTVNLKSMVLATQAAVPHLEASGGGSIINISSIASMRLAGLGGTSYMASKAGVNGLTMSLAGQLAESRIRVNAIAPGLVYGPIVADRLTPEVRERRRLAGLIKDEGNPWDVAWAAVYLASDESRWVTGQVIVVDGGAIIRTLDTP